MRQDEARARQTAGVADAEGLPEELRQYRSVRRKPVVHFEANVGHHAHLHLPRSPGKKGKAWWKEKADIPVVTTWFIWTRAVESFYCVISGVRNKGCSVSTSEA